MGNWNISIQGIGQHHNASPDVFRKDANVMANRFVEELRAAGHYIESASFTFGGKENLAPAAAPAQTVRSGTSVSVGNNDKDTK
jgi:hypothetical protein